MYHLSRAIYREIAPHLGPERDVRTHARVLRACERTVERLAVDPHYFARPARTLFMEIRGHVPIGAQGPVWQSVQHHTTKAAEMLRSRPELCDLDGTRPACQATTRRGAACQREPLPASRYCPSHQHLSETEEAHVRLAAVA